MPRPIVPLCDLQAQYAALQPQLEEAALRVLRSGQFVLGSEVSGFERELADYCGTTEAVGCSSGSDALLLAVRALGLGPGDEVILPTFTFFATVGAVHNTGAVPVFADIDPVSYNLCPEQVEAKITPRTRAILLVHLYGQCAEMDDLRDLAERHGLWVIEDAAQAIGAEYHGKRAGGMGHVGCFSFYPSKNLGANGEAGAVVTSNPESARRLRTLRVHGMEPKYYHVEIGWNARLDALQAALLRVKLPYVEQWTTARQQAGRRYDQLIADYGLEAVLVRPTILPQRRHVMNQYVVRVADGRRDALASYLRQEGVGCEIYYPVPLHLQECLRDLGHAVGDFPVSEQACQSVLALPMFPEITEYQQSLVLESCASFFDHQARQAA